MGDTRRAQASPGRESCQSQVVLCANGWRMIILECIMLTRVSSRICCTFFTALLIAFTFSANAQTGFSGDEEVTVEGRFLRYHNRSDALLASPGALRSGLLGFANPAMVSVPREPDLVFSWAPDIEEEGIDRWGLYAAVPGLSYGVRSFLTPNGRVNDNRLTLGADFDVVKAGLSYGWYGGDLHYDPATSALGRTLSAGVLFRATSFTSLGLTGTTSLSGSGAEAVVDLAIRPFSTELLTLFGEYAADTERGAFDGRFSTGAVFEPLAGVRVTGRYIEEEGVQAGVEVSLARAGVSYRRGVELVDDDNRRAPRDQYTVRIGAYDRNIVEAVVPDGSRYLELELRGSLFERRRFLFDQAPTIPATLDAIEKARTDRRIGGIVINATDMSLSMSNAWEVANALNRFRDDGKQVALYLERGGMPALLLATAADRVVMDPEGSLAVRGFSSTSTYLADLFDEYGIGVIEFRHAEYKSALEAFTRRDLSDPEREQRQAFIDTYYEIVRSAVESWREIDGERFDELVDYAPPIFASDLQDAGIVDSLARYSDIGSELYAIEGFTPPRVAAWRLEANVLPDDNDWAPRPRIGVVYALGMTATNIGMQAREVARELRQMRRDPSILGVVMRVDSPGGDILASDMVAQEVRRLAERKPVAVSMSGTAASGGYWISMYADRIFALPTTLTGSIGVINGWFYDEGFSRRLHLDSDGVQRGESADLFSGPSLPLVGLSLPARPPTDREFNEYARMTERWYERFLENVSEARGMRYADVEAAARGRIWTGEAAIDRDLIDEIGTFSDALRWVREQSGIPVQKRIHLVEGPDLPFVPFPTSLPNILAGGRPVARSGFIREHGLLARSRVFSRTPSDDRFDPASPDTVLTGYLDTVVKMGGRPAALIPFEHMHWIYRRDAGAVE